MNDKYEGKFKGVIKIHNPLTNEDKFFNNIVTNAFFNAIADSFTGTPGNGARYFGIGDGTPVVDPTTTALTNEILRKAITNLSTNGSEMIFLVSIDATEAVGQWNEIGLFENSTGTPMYTIAVVDYEHITGEPLNITYTISRV